MKKFFLLMTLMLAVASLSVAQTAKLQIIHNSPTPGTASGPAVDVYVNGALLPALDDFEFRTATPFLDVPSGVALEVGVALANSTSVDDTLVSFTVPPLAENSVNTAIAAGIVFDLDNPFNIFLNGNAKDAADDPTTVEFNVFHGSTDAPAVNVGIRTVGNVFNDVSFGDFTNYIAAFPTEYYVDIINASNDELVATFLADLSALAGGAATVFASGLLGDSPSFGLFAALPDGTVVELPASPVARVQIIHNSPSPTVDIYANDSLLVGDLEFRQATPYVFVPAGVDIEIAVAPGNSSSANDAIFDQTVNLVNGETYGIIANGIVGDPNDPFELAINAGALEFSPNPAITVLNVFHGSPDAPNVDIGFRTFGKLINDLPFGDFSDYLGVPVGQYFVDVYAAGDTNIVATFAANLNGLQGEGFTVFASGFLNPMGGQPSFGLFVALRDGQVIPLPAVNVARVQVVHNCPTPAADTVDVYLNGALLYDNLAFRNARPFTFVPADINLSIAIAPDTSTSVNSAIFTKDFTLENGRTYMITAGGDIGNATAPFDLYVDDMAKEGSDDPSLFSLNVFHGAPDAPNVDVADRGLGNLFTDVAFGEFTDHLEVDTLVYFIDIKPAGSENIVETYLVNLQGANGLAANVFASGFLNPEPGEPSFGLFGVLPNGAVIEWPVQRIAQVQVVHNSPEPTVDVYLGQNRLINDFAFRTATPYVFLPAGETITLSVAPETSTSVNDTIASFDVNLINNVNYQVFASGIVGDPITPFNLLINDSVRIGSGTPGLFEFQVHHGSPDAPNVDVRARTVADLLSDVPYGAFSDPINVDPQQYFIDVLVAGTDDIAGTFDVNVTGLGDISATVFASGLLAGDPDFGLFGVFPNGLVVEFPESPVARLQIVHNAPNPTVDIYANDSLLLDNFVFRDATPFDFIAAETNINIAVAPENSTSVNDAIADFDVNFINGETYAVFAGGVVGDPTTPFNLFTLEGARERAESGTGVDLNVFHGAPDAPGVDVVAQGVGVLFDNVSYGEFNGAGYQNVPAAEYTLDLTPADDNNTVLGTATADVSGLEGGAAIVFASGFFSGDDPAFNLWVVLPDGTTFPLDFVVGTNEFEASIEQLSLFPNPAISETTLSLRLSETAENVQMAIFGTNGQRYQLREIGTLPVGGQNISVDVSDLPAGNYMLTLFSDKGYTTRSFIVAE